MVSPRTVVGSVLKVLNNTSLLEDPVSGRNGSFFLGPNDALLFNKYMPKGNVVLDNEATTDQSFGNAFKRSKPVSVLVNFYTLRNVQGTGTTAGLKEDDLIYEYLTLVEDALVNNQDTIGFQITGIGDVEPPTKFGDQGIKVGTKSFTFSYRK